MEIPTELERYFATQQKDLDKLNRESANEEILENLSRLHQSLLQPLERLVGSEATITSGYRCAELNARVGGVRTSRHLAGLAADLTFGNTEKNLKAAKILKETLQYDQCEIHGNGRWLHVGLNYKNKPNRFQIWNTH